MATASPDEIDNAIKELGGEQPQSGAEQLNPELVEMENQAPGMAMETIGMTDELGGQLANANSLVL